MTHAEADGLTVGRAAALVGVSVKTLHHWDAVGLVSPSGRTRAGYRVYSADDVARIHRVLVYRELGFPLAEIGRILDDPSADARDHLLRQRAALLERAGRLREMARAVDRMLEALDAGLRLTPREQVEIFGADWRPEWVGEARDRWGGTRQWVQYAERAAGMTAQDWKDAVARTEALNADLAAARRAGVAPGSAEANALAERHRTLMSTYFDCTHAMHVCLGRMFAEDPGFAAYYDAMAPGLAGWLQDAISANAEAHGTDPRTAAWE
ncbi:MerR family transcriptional regulator [Actinomadura opuntiae]|uniref:MerR family transcriptional regulator n=1 Tax=Actinomadura sp. OS1-43 TaxID=604315 RepID=UPI00255A7891|nr:MerR family transcriptional regulator [Actinomadura sp. OS1-43]MDL4818232.1 MerR family transcriptional regulator [Actinomadura sp. OS1-43]